MPNFYLTFDVNGVTQTITATGTKKLRAGSKSYWYADFNFLDNSFDGLEKLSASFSTKPYSPTRTQAIIVPIVNNKAQIPWEMMARKRKFYIGVFAGDMLVTNEEIIEVTEAAPTGGIYSDPTSSWYSYYEETLEAKQDKLTAGEHINISDENKISADLGAVVLYSSQDLTDEEKLQARLNIEAGTEDVFTVEIMRRYSQGGFIGYEIITPYEDFINAVENEKTLWAKVPYGHLTITLHNCNYSDYNFRFWDSCLMDTESDPLKSILELKFELDRREGFFYNIEINNYPLASPTNAVLYDVDQELSDEDKLRARQNIGAGTDEVVTAEFIATNIDENFAWMTVNLLNPEEVWAAKESGKTLRASIEVGEGYYIYLNQFWDSTESQGFYEVIPSLTLNANANSTLCIIELNGNNTNLMAFLKSIASADLVATKTTIDKNAHYGLLSPNKVSWFYNPTSLNIVFGPNYNSDSLINEEDPVYHFFMTVGDDPVQISFPSDVGYAPGAINALTKTNTVIEVSVSKIPIFRLNNIDYHYLVYANYMEFNPWESNTNIVR